MLITNVSINRIHGIDQVSYQKLENGFEIDIITWWAHAFPWKSDFKIEKGPWFYYAMQCETCPIIRPGREKIIKIPRQFGSF